MRFEIEQRYRSGCEAVTKAYLDPGFYAGLSALPSVGHVELLEMDASSDRIRRRVRYAFQAHLSAAVRAVLDPSRLSWVDDATVDVESGRTDFRFLPDAYADRLSCSGVKTLRADGADGCVQHTVAELRVKAPFVAGPVERAIVSGLRENAAVEVELVDTWIAEASGPA